MLRLAVLPAAGPSSSVPMLMAVQRRRVVLQAGDKPPSPTPSTVATAAAASGGPAGSSSSIFSADFASVTGARRFHQVRFFLSPFVSLFFPFLLAAFAFCMPGSVFFKVFLLLLRLLSSCGHVCKPASTVAAVLAYGFCFMSWKAGCRLRNSCLSFRLFLNSHPSFSSPHLTSFPLAFVFFFMPSRSSHRTLSCRAPLGCRRCSKRRRLTLPRRCRRRWAWITTCTRGATSRSRWRRPSRPAASISPTFLQHLHQRAPLSLRWRGPCSSRAPSRRLSHALTQSTTWPTRSLAKPLRAGRCGRRFSAIFVPARARRAFSQR